MDMLTLKIEGMDCDHWVQSVKTALEGVAGVSQAQVDLSRGEAVVTLGPATASAAQLSSAVDDAGYKVVSA